MQLEQSPFLRFVSDDDIHDTLRMMGRATDSALSPEIAREVCQRTNATVTFAGSIDQIGTRYALNLRAVECANGNLLASSETEASDVVVAPTLNYGFYPAFVEYPGSTSLRLETSRDMIVDICRALSRFGPKRFYIINTGISAPQALAPAADSWSRMPQAALTRQPGNPPTRQPSDFVNLSR